MEGDSLQSIDFLLSCASHLAAVSPTIYNKGKGQSTTCTASFNFMLLVYNIAGIYILLYILYHKKKLKYFF